MTLDLYSRSHDHDGDCAHRAPTHGQESARFGRGDADVPNLRAGHFNTERHARYSRSTPIGAAPRKHCDFELFRLDLMRRSQAMHRLISWPRCVRSYMWIWMPSTPRLSSATIRHCAASPSRSGEPPPVVSLLRRATKRARLASGRQCHRHRHVWTPLADQGLFLALRWSWVRSCLRPFARAIGSAGPDVVR